MSAWSALGPGDEELQRGASARGGVWLLIGEQGVGKTALAEELLLAWRARGAAALVRDCSIAFVDLADLLLERLSPEHHYLATSSAEPAVDHLEAFLLGEAEAKRSVTLLFDDAEHLPEDTLEWLALLFEAQYGAGNSLRIILAATPNFRDRLSGSWFASLRRYMGLPIGLTPLQGDEIEPYLKHRARHGKGPRLRSISSLALKRFYELSHGRCGPLNDLFDQAWSQAQLNAVDRITLVQLEPEASGDLDHEGDFPSCEPAEKNPLEDSGRTDSPAWVLDPAIWDALERDQKPLPPEASGRIGFKSRKGQGQQGYDYGASLSGLESLEATAKHRAGDHAEGSAAYAFSPDYDLLEEGDAPDNLVPEKMERAVLALPDLAEAESAAADVTAAANAAPSDARTSGAGDESLQEGQQERPAAASHLHPVETPPHPQQLPRRQRPNAPPHLRVLSGDQDVTPESRQAPPEDTVSEKTDRVEEPDEGTNEKTQAEALAPSQAALQEESAAARSSLTWLEICARSELNEIKARQELGVKSVISRVQVTPTAAAHDEGDGETDDADVKGGKGLFGSGFGNLTVFLASFFGALLLISALIVFWPAGEPENVQIKSPTVSANRAVNMKALAAWQRPSIVAERTASDPHAYLPPPLTEYGFTLPRRKPSPEAPAPVENAGENHSALPNEPRAEEGPEETGPRADVGTSANEPAAAVLATQTEAASQRMAAEVTSQEAESTVNPEGVTSASASLHPEVLSVLPPAFAEATAPNAAKILNASNGPAPAVPVVDIPVTEEAVAAARDLATEEPQDRFVPVVPDSNQVDTALRLEDGPAKDETAQDLVASASAETDAAPQPAEETEDVAKALTETASEPAVPTEQDAIETVADFDSEVTTLGPDELVTPAPPRAKPVAPEPSVERQVLVLLAKAAASEENRRLTQPAEDSAVDLYRQVLELDPQNRTAKESIDRIHGLFLAWAVYAEQEGNLDRAARHLRKALWIAPDNDVTEARLAAVQERLKADAILAGFEPDTATQEDEGTSVAAELTEQAEQEVTTSDQGQTSEDQADEEAQQIEKAAPPKPQPKYHRARNLDIDSDQVVALVETGNVAAVSLLLEAGGPVNEPDSFGTAPLFYAISYGNPNMVALFLEWGAEVAARNPSEETPLMLASRLGRTEIAKQLLAANADPNERNEAGWTAIFLSAARGHVEITQALIDAGARVDYADPQGRTALTESASNGEVGTLAALISAGADVNARDAKGMTPLMLAAEKGHAQTVRILLAADADSAIKSRDGRTAATLASDKGYGEIATIIMPHL